MKTFWEWTGKIATIVAVVGGIVLIYQWIYPDTPRLTIKGEYYEWPEAETSIRARLFWRFDIENIGGEVAKNVQLGHPFFGKFAIGNDQELKETNKEPIGIGDLQPSDKKTINLWSLDGSDLFKNEIKVVYDSGVEKVDYSTQVYGVTAWIINNSFILLIVLIGILIILSMILIDDFTKRKQRDVQIK